MQAEEDTLENVVYDIELEIKNTDGLHMRPAMQFVDVANRFKSEINVGNNEMNADTHPQIFPVRILGDYTFQLQAL